MIKSIQTFKNVDVSIEVFLDGEFIIHMCEMWLGLMASNIGRLDNPKPTSVEEHVVMLLCNPEMGIYKNEEKNVWTDK